MAPVLFRFASLWCPGRGSAGGGEELLGLLVAGECVQAGHEQGAEGCATIADSAIRPRRRTCGRISAFGLHLAIGEQQGQAARLGTASEFGKYPTPGADALASHVDASCLRHPESYPHVCGRARPCARQRIVARRSSAATWRPGSGGRCRAPRESSRLAPRGGGRGSGGRVLWARARARMGDGRTSGRGLCGCQRCQHCQRCRRPC